MKGTTLVGLAVSALISTTATLAVASTASLGSGPVPRPVARPPRANEIRFETQRHHLPGDEITLGDTYYAPSADQAPTEGAQGVLPPIDIPVESVPATPSRGPHIIYIGKETERQRTGFMPQVIYGDLPSRTVNGPEVLYGGTVR